MNERRKPIGVYDSGIGGLTVLSLLHKKFPHEDFIYFADTANVPYGPKTPEQITDFSRAIVEWMCNEMGVKLVVAACHTSSGIALEQLAPNYTVPLIGTMMPVANAVRANNALHQRIGVIATQASVNRRAHEQVLRAHGFDGELVSIACPEFVPLIESGVIDEVALSLYAREYLKPFYDQRLDTLIYGCTHYPLIADIIKAALPRTIHYIDPAEHIAREVDAYLSQNALYNDSPEPGKTSFYCSGPMDEFIAKVEQFMPLAVPMAFAKKA